MVKSVQVCCQFCTDKRTLKDKRAIAKLTDLYTCPKCLHRIRERKALVDCGIDWQLTLKEYGYDYRSMPVRSKIIVCCSACKKPMSIKFRSVSELLKQLKNGIYHRTCHKHTESTKERCRSKSQAYWRDPKSRKLASEISSGKWRDPEFRQAVVDGLLASNSFTNWDSNQHSVHSKRLWSDNEFRLKLLSFLKGRGRQLMIELWADEEYREKLSKTAFWSPQPSKLQRRLIPILDRLDIKWEEEYRIKWWHFDYFLPDKKVLIEVQGNYWHSKPEVIIRDKRKRTFVKNNTDFSLIEIWENEFNDIDAIAVKLSSLQTATPTTLCQQLPLSSYSIT